MTNFETVFTCPGDERQPTYVSMFYTFLVNGWNAEAHGFSGQCYEFGLPHIIYQVRKEDYPPAIRKQQNIKEYKATYNKIIPFVIGTALKMEERPVIYCHVDSQIRKRPPQKCFDRDVLLSMGHGAITDTYPNRRWHILANAIYARPTDLGFEFVRRWQELCCQDIPGSEHGPLKRTYDTMRVTTNSVGLYDVQMCSRSLQDNPYIYC